MSPTGLCYVTIYKNGTRIAENFDHQVSNYANPIVTTIVDMNGTTDYLEMYGYNTGGTTFSAAIEQTYLTGTLIAPYAAAGGGSGVSAMASLTDVTLTNLAGRDYLRYDTGTSKWVNISESTVMSTTMVAGWPDAIVCGDGTNTRLLFLRTLTSSAAIYEMPYNATYYINFNLDKTYNSHSNLGSYNCLSKPISQLYSEGRAFNFIGGASSSALGDRITSGTLAVTANSATSYVSRSTAGTTWGYLANAGSYLPNISSNYVSASGISVSGVVQVSGSAPTCSSAIKGAIRYSNTSSTLEYCNSTAWTSVGPSATSVPAFSAYNGSNMTVPANVATLISFTTERFDTNNNFASSRFTPTIAGKYPVNMAVTCGNPTVGYCLGYIYKNGSAITQNWTRSPNSQITASTMTLVDMNGTTDYLEGFVYTDATTLQGAAVDTFFTGTLIAPYGAGGTGGATPGGTDTQVQFNDGGSALGGDADYTWNKTSNVLTVTGDINYTGLLTDTSDRRQKKNIQEFSGDALERLMKLRPVTFQMKQGGSGVEYGFIAQDVLPLFPELVRDRDDTLSLNYIGLMAPMVKAMQEMKAENDVVAAQNRQLRESLHNLAAEVKTLRKAVQRSHGTVH